MDGAKGVLTVDPSAATWRLGAHAVHLSHLDKLYWPRDGLTKGDLLAYYRDMAPVMLPYFAGRPITLRMFPEGIDGASFYQRNLPERAPRWAVRRPFRSRANSRWRRWLY